MHLPPLELIKIIYMLALCSKATTHLLDVTYVTKWSSSNHQTVSNIA